MKLGEIAASLGLELNGDGALVVKKAAPLPEAGPEDIAFVQDRKMESFISASGAGALIVPPGIEPGRPAIVTDNPQLAMARVVALLQPEPAPSPGVDGSAVIGENVSLGDGVFIGPLVSVGDGSRIGSKVAIHAGARVGADCVIGDGTVIFANVVLYDETRIGKRCRIHANTTLGADGFGYIRLDSGAYHKIPQRGHVELEDDVEIGANSSIDRAALGTTLIKSGAKIDNQVQVGHNCVVGENAVIAGCSGLAGSVTIGKGVMIGGMSAISDHVTLADGVIIAGKTGAHADISQPGVYGGPLAMKHMEYKRFMLSGKRLDKLEKRFRKLEEVVKDL